MDIDCHSVIVTLFSFSPVNMDGTKVFASVIIFSRNCFAFVSMRRKLVKDWSTQSTIKRVCAAFGYEIIDILVRLFASRQILLTLRRDNLTYGLNRLKSPQ